MSSGAVMMQCGHAANSEYKGAPACVICFGISPGATVVDEVGPLLEGRTARCYCGKEAPSSTGLAFFEYRGPGSTAAGHCRHCRYAKVAHEHDPRRVSPRPHPATQGHTFEPLAEGWPTDLYYCGHGGWD